MLNAVGTTSVVSSRSRQFSVGAVTFTVVSGDSAGHKHAIWRKRREVMTSIMGDREGRRKVCGAEDCLLCCQQTGHQSFAQRRS